MVGNTARRHSCSRGPLCLDMHLRYFRCVEGRAVFRWSHEHDRQLIAVLAVTNDESRVCDLADGLSRAFLLCAATIPQHAPGVAALLEFDVLLLLGDVSAEARSLLIGMRRCLAPQIVCLDLIDSRVVGRVLSSVLRDRAS